MSDKRFKREKFKELVLYLVEKSETDSSFGVSKLGRLLYYCDFAAYVELGHPHHWRCLSETRSGSFARGIAIHS